MKRFHVRLRVDDIGKSVAFYSKLFAAEPARIETDYAKWMLDDPRINFALSARGATTGIDHLGLQTDDAAGLAELKARAEAAGMTPLDAGEAICCYARSYKHWITDPQGVAWEHFRTLESVPVFGERPALVASDTALACCAQKALSGRPVGVAVKAAVGCC